MMRRRDLAALIAPVLTGCTGSNNRVVRIAVSTGLAEPYLIHLAHSLGYFRDQGLDVVIQEFPGSRQMESLLGGTSDAIYTTYSSILLLAGDAHLLRSIFVGIEAFSAVLAVSGKKAAQIRQMKDLKGATIGVATLGSPQDQQLEILLRGDGLRRDDVSVVAYGNGPAAIASLQFEKVDAGMINGSAFNVLKRRAPEVRALVDPRTREATAQLTGVERWPNFCLLARVAWLDQNPAVAQRLVNAITRALGWTHAHTAEELRDRLPASLRTEDAECDLETLRVLIAATSKDGRMAPDAPAGVQRYIARANEQVRNANIDLAGTYTNRFVDEASR